MEKIGIPICKEEYDIFKKVINLYDKELEKLNECVDQYRKWAEWSKEEFENK